MPEENIDISLSLLSNQSGIEFMAFVNELKTLNESVAAMRGWSAGEVASANGRLSEGFHSQVNQDMLGKYVDQIVEEIQSVRDAIMSGGTQAGPYDSNVAPTTGQASANASSPDENNAQEATRAQNLSNIVGSRMGDFFGQKGWTRPVDWTLGAMGLAAGNQAQYVPPGGGGGGIRGLLQGAQGNWSTAGGLFGEGVKGLLEDPFVQTLAQVGAYSHFSRNRGGGSDPSQDLPYDMSLSPDAGQIGQVGGDQFGFRIPGAKWLSELGTHQIGEKWKRFKLSMAPGISRDQANQMIDGLYAAGRYQGNLRDNMLNDVREAAQRTPGMWGSPEGINDRIEMLDRATRYGAVSIKEFTGEMANLNEIAIKTGHNTSRLREEMKQVAEAQEGRGSSYFSGLQFAKQAMAVTGWNPEFHNQLQDNPWVQSQAMMQYGLLPNQMGLMTPGAQLGSQFDAIDMLLNTYSGYKSRKVTNEDGLTSTIAGSDLQATMVAQALGLPPDMVRDYMKNRDQMKSDANLISDTDSLFKNVDDNTNNYSGSYFNRAKQLVQHHRAATAVFTGANFDRYRDRVNAKVDGKYVYTETERQRLLWGEADHDDYEHFKRTRGKQGAIDFVRAKQREAMQNDPLARIQAMRKAAEDITSQHEKNRNDDMAEKGDVVGTLQISLNGDAKRFFDTPASIQIGKTSVAAGTQSANSLANLPRIPSP
jgi:hypothetical protein